MKTINNSIRFGGLIFSFILFFLTQAACVDTLAVDPAVHTFDTGQPFEQFVTQLRAAIVKHNMTILEGACGLCGIRTLPHPDKEALIITVSRKRLMLEMLQSGAAMGAEPPLRFYITHSLDGTARLRYHQPSAAFAVYQAPWLRSLGKELDVIFAHITTDAVSRNTTTRTPD